MEIDFDEELKDLDGNVISELNPATVTPETPKGVATKYTMKLVAVRALTTPLSEDQSMTGEQAFNRLELARKINKGGKIELDSADKVLIRERVAKIFNIQVSGQVYDRLR